MRTRHMTVAEFEFLRDVQLQREARTMTENDLVEKLRAMREHGPKDLMTMLFGLIFHQEIGRRGPSPDFSREL